MESDIEAWDSLVERTKKFLRRSDKYKGMPVYINSMAVLWADERIKELENRCNSKKPLKE